MPTSEHSAIYTFYLHKAIIGIKNKNSVFLRVAVLHRFYTLSVAEQFEFDVFANIEKKV